MSVFLCYIFYDKLSMYGYEHIYEKPYMHIYIHMYS
jgi:hypothetical protein